MAATYFTLPSFARAKKHTEELAKTNPKSPILNDEDEKFLERITSNGDKVTTETSKAQINDEGDMHTLPPSADSQIILPGDGRQAEGMKDSAESEQADTTKGEEQAPSLPPRPKTKKQDFVELPSQEEAEAATKGFATATQQASDDSSTKKTWSSYLPTVPSLTKSQSDKDQSNTDKRSWAQYASSIVPNNLPSLPASWTKSKDAKAEPVLNEDGSINEEATKEKEEKEVSVLLDNLNLSSINNRVFAFSEESQKLYERFVQVLKDTINGVPTAYEDTEKLMREAGPTIERQWNAMPPFVQAMVKSLPAKLSATVAPEFLATIMDKPGNDAKAMDAASAQASKGGDTDVKSKPAKKKRVSIPGLKGLIKKKGLAATLLSNITTFLKTRFPFLLGATNVTMSLSVFILMFVFYYCWKRGREVRLAKEAENTDGDGQDNEIEVELTDEDSCEEAIGTKTESTEPTEPTEAKS